MHSEFVVAIHSLVLLAYTPERLRTSENIADSIVIHPVRVRKVLSVLRQHGFIQSKEGAKGGFYLSRDPDSISLGDLYRLFAEGTTKPKWPETNPNCPIGGNIESAMAEIFDTGEQELKKYFDQYTIAGVLHRVYESAW